MMSDAYPGLDVCLRSAGTDLPEYELEEDSDYEKSAFNRTCYAEAVSGATFSIEFRFGADFGYLHNELLAKVYLDGVHARSPVFQLVNGQLSATRKITGVTTRVDGRWEFSEFAFTQLETNEETPRIGLKERLAHLGEVTVKLFRCRSVGPIESVTKRNAFRGVVESAVPEKVLKGRTMSTHVKLSDPIPTRPPSDVCLQYPWGKEPLATFTFKYRSRSTSKLSQNGMATAEIVIGDLQAKGILPPDVPLEERDPNTLTLHEARELIQRQSLKLQDHVKVKKEKRDHSAFNEDLEEDGGGIEVIGQASVNKRRIFRPASEIEVVDLTDD